MQRATEFWSKHLMSKMISYFVLLSLLTVGLVSYMAFVRAQEALKQSIFNRLNAVATLKEDSLIRWADEQRRNIVFVAWLPEVRLQAGILLNDPNADSPASQVAYTLLSQYLGYIVTSTSDSQELFILDLNGQIVFSTNKLHEGQSWPNTPYFVMGRSTTYVQNVYPSSLTNKPTITIATPLFDQGKRRVGVLAAHLDLSRIDRIILERTGLGQSGETYLVSPSHGFVSEALFQKQGVSNNVHSQGIDEALQGHDGSGLYVNYAGTPVIGVYRWIDEQEMALLAEISQEEAFGLARQLGLTIGLAGLVIACALAVGVNVLARRLISPVFDLVSGAERVAQGRLDEPVPVRSEDELGTLAQAFNAMQAKLNQSYLRLGEYARTLEQRVEERTLELQQRAVQLQTAAEISRTASSTLDLAALLQQSVELICERFGLYYVGLFLVDEEQQWAWLRAGRGAGSAREAAQHMLSGEHKLAISDTSMIGWCVQHAQARIALDVGQEAVRFNNPFLPKTRSEMALPLITRDEVIGALTVQSDQPQAFDEADITILQTMADQLANAIGNARLYTSAQQELTERKQVEGMLRHQNEYLNALNETMTGLIRRLELTDLLQAIVNRAGVLVGSSHGYIYLLEPDKTEMKMHIGSGIQAELVGLKIEPGHGLSGMTWQTGEPMVVNDYNTWPGRLPSPVDTQIHAVVCVPLKSSEQVIGVIGLIYTEPDRFFGDNELELLNRFAGLAAVAIDNAQLYAAVQQELTERRQAEVALQESQRQLKASFQREQERLRLSNTLREVAKIVSGSLDQQKVLDMIFAQLEKVITYHHATVTLVSGDVLTMVTKRDKSGSLPANRTLSIEQFPLNAVALQSKQPVLVPNVSRDPRWIQDSSDPSVRSFINAPMLIQDRPIGLLSVTRNDGVSYTEEDAQTVFAFANQVAVALESARLHEYELEQVEREREIARQIQMSLLPSDDPHMRGLDIAGFSKAARQVGGDFYNYFVFDREHIGIAVGDVSGKGMQAALMMALSYGLLTNQVRREVTPAKLLAEMNDEIRPHTQRNKLNTALCYLTMNFAYGAWESHVANAGLVSPLVRHADGKVEWLEVGGLPLGTMEMEDGGYREVKQRLAPGSALILSSDGIIEAMNPRGELYSFERLVKCFEAAPVHSAQALQEHILRNVNAFVAGAETHDDLTLVAIVVQ